MDIDNSFSEDHYGTPKRKVLGDLSNGSPVSPMANLKLLTKVATSPAHVFTPDTCVIEDHCKCSKHCIHCTATVNKKSFECGYIRRTKSLSVLCEKFLFLFPLNVGSEETRLISIKHMASDLGVEKRRVYDIVNIVESLDMAKKIAKDSYMWYGNQNVPAKIASLKQYAYSVGLDKLVNEFFGKKGISNEMLPLNLFSVDERRIGVLCQKFVMLLLVCRNKIPITLDVAAVLLIGGNESSKTKSRRLYDISNMLMTLGIISRLKNDVPGNPFKKPAFIYSGPCFDAGCKCKNCVDAIEQYEQDSLVSTVSCQTDLVDLSDNTRSAEEMNKHPMCSRSDIIKEPVAKKRLVFKQDMNIVFKPITENIIHKQFDLKACKRLGSIVIQRPAMKLEPGSLYKAVKVGSSMQLIKIP